MRRFAVFFTAMVLLLNISAIGSYGDTPILNTSVQKKVMLYLKPDVTVELNGHRQIFKDVNRQTVYPIIYNGTTYLPVRAVSALMKEPVEWDSGSKTVYIGKTLTNPNKGTVPIPTGAAVSVDDEESGLPGLTPSLVAGYIKPDVLVMYDFVIQTFRDVNGVIVYPIIYNGSAYLPIRAVSNLMDEPVTWDGNAKKICIGDGEEEKEESEESEEPEESEDQQPAEEEVSDAFLLLDDIYEREEALYFEATAKITSIKDTVSTEDKQLIAASASENYLKAQALTVEAKEIDQTDFTTEEKAVCEKLVGFAESTEYYILVLENIAYLAAADSDYSMLAETFLYFAMESKTKMEEAKELLSEL